MSLQTTLAAEAHLAEGQSLLQKGRHLTEERLWYAEKEQEDQRYPKQKGRI
jgi:hypothetical protein